MSSNNCQIKNQAKVLCRALEVLSPKDSIFNPSVPVKVPTLNQCLEILSRAYGANTYKGFELGQYDSADLDKRELKKQLEIFIRKSNPIEYMDLPTAHYYTDHGITPELDLNYMGIYFDYAESFPCFNFLKPFKNYTQDIWLYDFYEMRSKKTFQFDSYSMVTSRVLLNNIIDCIGDLDRIVTAINPNEVILTLGLSTFYVNSIYRDVDQARSGFIQIYELLHDAGFNVIMRKWVEEDPQESRINFIVSRAQYEYLIKIREFGLLKANAMNYFKDSLGGMGIIIDSGPKKLTGIEFSKYYLLQFLYSGLLAINHGGYSAGHIAVSEDSTKGLNQAIRILKGLDDQDFKKMIHALYGRMHEIDTLLGLDRDTSTKEYIDKLDALLNELKSLVIHK